MNELFSCVGIEFVFTQNPQLCLLSPADSYSGTKSRCSLSGMRWSAFTTALKAGRFLQKGARKPAL